jgi:hypothetical protein
MARINLETALWGEFSFQTLLIKVGNRHAAKGMVTELFTLAQKYWFPLRCGIPIKEIELAELTPTIEAGLAELRGDVVYVHGSEEAFAWLFEKQKGGKKSAEARKKKFGSAQPRVKKSPKSPNSVRTEIEQRSNEFTEQTSNSPEQPRSSLLSSPSSLFPSLSSDLFPQGGEIAKTPAEANARAFLAAYCRAWKLRYKTNPPIGGKPAGLAKQIVKDLGTEKACTLVETFLRMEDYWFLKKRHDLGTFKENLNAVVQYHDTGESIGETEARHADSASFHKNQMQRILEGKL